MKVGEIYYHSKFPERTFEIQEITSKDIYVEWLHWPRGEGFATFYIEESKELIENGTWILEPAIEDLIDLYYESRP